MSKKRPLLIVSVIGIMIAFLLGCADSIPDKSSSSSHNSIDRWTTINSMNDARVTHKITKLDDGLVLVTGGVNSVTGNLASCEIFDHTSNSWSSTGSMNETHRSHTATLLADGRVLVVGGRRDNTYLTSCELYDPNTEEWTYTDSISESRAYHQATVLNDGRVLLSGGNSGSGNGTIGCEIYDPVTDTWSDADNYESGKAFPFSFAA